VVVVEGTVTVEVTVTVMVTGSDGDGGYIK
jgi:hypothetical protein